MTEKSLATIETSMKSLTLSSDEVQFIKEYICGPQNITDQEFKLFIATAQMTGANPLLNEVFAVKYKGQNAKMAIIFHHDFLIRKVNENYDDFQGFSDPEFWDGTRWVEAWTDEIKSSDHLQTAPQMVRIGVWRKGAERPAKATVSWRSKAKVYNGDLQAMWKIDPLGQIIKCAQVAALRDSYGSIVGTMYTREEMHMPEDTEGMVQRANGEWYTPQGDSNETKATRESTKRIKSGDLRDPGDVKISAVEHKRMTALFKDLKIAGKDKISKTNEILEARKCDTVDDLVNMNKHQAAIVITALNQEVENLPDPEPGDDPKLIEGAK